MSQQHDEELFDEQMMLQALLSEADVENPLDSQIAFNDEMENNRGDRNLNDPSNKKNGDSNGKKHTDFKNNVIDQGTSSINKSNKLKNLHDQNTKSPTLNYNAVDLSKNSEFKTSILNNTRIDINLSIGDISVKYEEIIRLKPGQVFNLQKNFNSPVTLLHNNSILGTAEIIDIDGSIGIIVRSVF